MTPVPPARADDGLYDRPVLVIDPGLHTAPIRSADVDAAGLVAVTGSHDRTVRLWSLADGRLLRTIRGPRGPGEVGKIYAVAISPAGDVIAAGGWTGTEQRGISVSLFDRDGRMTAQIVGLPNVVKDLAFSPDGHMLAVALGGPNSLRLYDRREGWAERARDPDYGAQSNGVAFARDGRLATTSDDGRVRLYDRAFHRVAVAATVGGRRPFGLAFSPDGDRLAVGFGDCPAVEIVDGHTLAARPGPDTAGIATGNLSAIAWSADGETLFAAGQYGRGGENWVVAWAGAGQGERRVLPGSGDTIMTLAPLPEGGLLVAAQDPTLIRLGPDDTRVWTRATAQADFRGQRATLGVSADGSMVAFGYEPGGHAPARFDGRLLRLGLDPPADALTARPKQDGLALTDWMNARQPRLDGRPLPLAPNEMSRSLAVHPAGDRFVLGSDWGLRAFDAAGRELWRQPVPSVVWAVNIAGDGRLVVAAYGDGTIRWHRMNDGQELLAFKPLGDRRNWVAWTPEGFYGATPGARSVLGWHVNRGWDEAGELVPVSEISHLYRPAVLSRVLQELDTVRALGLVELERARGAVRRRTGTRPGARLHVLTVGIDDYGPDADHLRLTYAARDAWEVLNVLDDSSQGSLYAEVVRYLLLNRDATKTGILQTLKTLREVMGRGEGKDVAVVLVAGHGGLVDDKFYLLPYQVDTSTKTRIRATALSGDELREEVTQLGTLGRVLLLLDTCHAGAATAVGGPLVRDARAVHAALAMTNVSVVTSSSADQISVERAELGHGVFTWALLHALRGGADREHTGRISMNHLADTLVHLVSDLTGNRQQPAIGVTFPDDVFVTLPA